jgi:hypothetical protein
MFSGLFLSFAGSLESFAGSLPVFAPGPDAGQKLYAEYG